MGSLCDIAKALFSGSWQKRDAKYELLRVYAVFCVVLRHVGYLGFGRYFIEDHGFTLLTTMTASCNTIFLFLSAYFTVNSELKLSRMLNIYLQVFLYSIAIHLFGCIIGYSKFDKASILHYYFPIANSIFWFPGPFLFSQIIFGIFKIGFKSINYRLQLFIIICFCISAWGNISGYFYRILSWDEGMHFPYFIYCYLIATFLKINDIKLKASLCVLGFVISLAIAYSGDSKYFDLFIHNKTILNILDIQVLHSPWPTFQAIFLLLLCEHGSISKIVGNVINFIADHGFGIYLIHTHPILLDRLMHQFGNQSYKSKFFPLLIRSLIVFLECFLADVILSSIFNLIIFNTRWYRYLIDIIDRFIVSDSIYSHIQEEIANNTNTDVLMTDVQYLSEKEINNDAKQ